MDDSVDFDDQWSALLASLPSGFDLDGTARSLGAFDRARQVKDPAALLRLALVYGGCGMSLRQTCAWAAETGLAEISDPALLKRLRNAQAWLAGLTQALLSERIALQEHSHPPRRLCAVDATALCEPGAKGTSWRLHVGYDLVAGQVDQLTLTDDSGAESLSRFVCRPGDIVLADRGYAKARDLRPVIDAGADFITRMGWNALHLLQPDGSAFDLFGTLARVLAGNAEIQVAVDERIKGATPLGLRLVIIRKSEADAARAQADVRRSASKRCKTLDPRSLEAAKYVLLLTSLPAAEYPAARVADLYRLRWQIELAFKRWKSLAGLDRLPAKDPALARSWIYARLIAALLAEKTTGPEPESSPSGAETGGSSFALAVYGHRPANRPRRHRRPPKMGGDQSHRHKMRPLHTRPAA
jgi:hypothetical protein